MQEAPLAGGVKPHNSGHTSIPIPEKHIANLPPSG